MPARYSIANSYKRGELSELDEDSKGATDYHLVDAADHVVQILDAHGIPYAIMGGFSLRLRGSPRVTFDLDLAVAASMLQLRTAFAGDSR